TMVSELKDGTIRSFEITAADAGLVEADPEALKGGDAAHNAAALKEVLAGARNAYRDIAVVNAAAALVVAGKAEDLKAGADLAARSLDEGKARAALDAVIRVS